ncbi:leucine-rich repeat protein SHOC-2 isoform X2 [Harpegnathos saltator]|nr:leucine-rich repeat protein SHOC-2 isoform X2 [Harpegnathos saltator]XP_025159789.1 leucine-rich repeat protein SHOC-2 isoform X2 [Harpegnathos saltator]XP_025159790.1 leucine-rich repeat protein SHOC-2 isoform X2 [Harpegnathos saltator]XP_025159791.1 leucine-rich repeat protein SHOC-2 isoform X2 [Harpegnathos saltator]XP_025159792.1 leucine-rich repeat protein SHOC-2 isoform X2 [Harpegnathos saltator]
MANEIKSKTILHWNCRGLMKLPKAIKLYGSHIKEIYLKWNKLTTLPPWIMKLFNVTSLYMHGNLIEQLPVEFGKMNQLTVLNLDANQLKQVPICIGNLRNLKHLSMNNNFIEELPIELSQLSNLQILSVSSNQIIALPEWTGSLPKLEELYADNNLLKELPNRLTLAPELSMISVSLNRLTYFPLNGFLSSPVIIFDANEYLNYVSYPLLLQILSQGAIINRLSLAYGCFKTHYNTNVSSTNIKLYIETKGLYENKTDIIIELPRQLLKIHKVHENVTCSLWELALRKIYTERYKHTLELDISSPNVTIFYSLLPKDTKLDFILSTMNCISYNLLTNGPISICVNSQCEQPIFTEAWTIVGVHSMVVMETVITIALCCSKSCASAFTTHSNFLRKFRWHSIN